jgi:hypothetical protein
MGKLTYYLLWIGDADNASELLAALDEMNGGISSKEIGFHARHAAIRSPMDFLYPDQARRSRRASQHTESSLPSPLQHDSEATLTGAERILQERGMSDHALASITTALMALICEDMLDHAASWCSVLLNESEGRGGSPLWGAVLNGFWSMIETRRGNLSAAEDYAHTALTLLTKKAWGVAIGKPLSSLLLTAIASRRHENAASYLQVPVPEAMFGTPYGLLYLYARGEYYLATGRAQAALADFRACGDRMITWGLDRPGLVPWRIKAAEAYLAMGNGHTARELSEEQLAQVGSRSSRTRGISLRVLARTSPPGKRIALLRESAEVLRDSGARLELAYTFSELSNAYLALGEHDRAHWAALQAKNLAAQCGAKAPESGINEANYDPHERADKSGSKLFTHLSNAERRVALLAACGYTNCQISKKLYITVSTVEQHLTRVYRKLGVTGRAGLPIEILVAMDVPVAEGKCNL